MKWSDLPYFANVAILYYDCKLYYTWQCIFLHDWQKFWKRKIVRKLSCMFFQCYIDIVFWSKQKSYDVMSRLYSSLFRSHRSALTSLSLNIPFQFTSHLTYKEKNKTKPGHYLGPECRLYPLFYLYNSREGICLFLFYWILTIPWLSFETVALMVLGQFSIGPQISENWPRTIRATVPQLPMAMQCRVRWMTLPIFPFQL